MEMFHQAIIDGDLSKIDVYIQIGLTIDQSYGYYQSRTRVQKSFTPLICAVEHEQINVVQHFLDKGADVLIKLENGETALSTAARKGSLEMVRLLLENGAKPNMQTALLVAIENKNLDIVKYMVEKDVCVNWEYASCNGGTPLSISISRKCGEIAKFLIDNGASLEKFYNSYGSPLILSVEYRMLDILKYLIQKGANIDQIDNNGQTALSMAAEKRNLACAKYLIESGADVNLAQKAVDGFAQKDEDFKYFLKLFTMKQLKSNSSEEASSTTDNKCLHCRSLLKFSEKKSGPGQNDGPSPKRIKGSDQEEASSSAKK